MQQIVIASDYLKSFLYKLQCTKLLYEVATAEERKRMLSRLLKVEGEQPSPMLSLCLKRYITKRTDVSPVVVFQALLLLNAPLLIQGSFELVNYFALGAYFILGIAVVLRILSFIRLERIEARERND
jgi:hypothetical protein